MEDPIVNIENLAKVLMSLDPEALNAAPIGGWRAAKRLGLRYRKGPQPPAAALLGHPGNGSSSPKEED
jgi:hypothetical protein